MERLISLIPQVNAKEIWLGCIDSKVYAYIFFNNPFNHVLNISPAADKLPTLLSDIIRLWKEKSIPMFVNHVDFSCFFVELLRKQLFRKKQPSWSIHNICLVLLSVSTLWEMEWHAVFLLFIMNIWVHVCHAQTHIKQAWFSAAAICQGHRLGQLCGWVQKSKVREAVLDPAHPAWLDYFTISLHSPNGMNVCH